MISNNNKCRCYVLSNIKEIYILNNKNLKKRILKKLFVYSFIFLLNMLCNIRNNKSEIKATFKRPETLYFTIKQNIIF